jgi:menaquinone-dependent protoporphyrinogen oxidase
MTVLVIYATAHGSTQGVAERIAARLGERGVPATARPAGRPDGLAGARAVVIGSATHHGQWLADAADYVRRNAHLLRGRPIWAFSVGSLGEGSSAFGPRLSGFLRGRRPAHVPAAQRECLADMAPVDHHEFAGITDAEHWGRAGTALLYAVGGRPGDHRDWAEVDAWADAIADQLVCSQETREAAVVAASATGGA